MGSGGVRRQRPQSPGQGCGVAEVRKRGGHLAGRQGNNGPSAQAQALCHLASQPGGKPVGRLHCQENRPAHPLLPASFPVVCPVLEVFFLFLLIEICWINFFLNLVHLCISCTLNPSLFRMISIT